MTNVKDEKVTLPTTGMGTGAAVNAGIAGVGLTSPFMGMIGESKITKDPYYNSKIKRMGYKELSRMAQPGDVLLVSSRNGPGYYKMPQEAMTGSEFFHAEPVAFKGKKGPVLTAAGLLDPRAKGTEYADDTVESILAKGKGTPFKNLIGGGKDSVYENAVLMRPKKRMTPQEIKAYQKQLITRGREHYSNPQALRAYLRDIFIPKIKGVTDRVKPLGDNCKGEICSTLPGGAYEKITGAKVSPGKHSRSILPADLLRSNSAYEAVGSTLKGSRATLSPGQRIAQRLAFRGRLGATIAGTGLLAYNEPEALAGIAAGAATPIATRAIVNSAKNTDLRKLPKGSTRRKLYAKLKSKVRNLNMDLELPATTDLVEAVEDRRERSRQAKLRGKMYRPSRKTSKIFRNFFRRSTPLAAGVGLGTYGSIKGIEHLLAKESSAPKPAETEEPQSPGLGAGAAVNAGIAGAGFTAPFMGLIGERKITEDPYYNSKIKRMSHKELRQLAQPGDILMMSSRDSPGPYKMPQQKLTGSEFFHAEPVVFRNKRGPITMEAGRYDPTGKAKAKFKNDTVESILEKAKGTRMIDRLDDTGHAMYEDAVLLRPKKGMTPQELEAYQKQLVSRGRKQYSGATGVRSYLRDLFIPKIKGVTDRIKPLEMSCVGESCSTLPSGAYEDATKTKMAPGKHSRSVLPADMLRSNSAYEAVGASLRNPDALSTPGRRLAKRLAYRAGIGGTIAGTGVMAYNEPEVIPAMAAGVAAPMGARKLINHLQLADYERMDKGSLKRKIYEKLERKVRDLDTDIELPKSTTIASELEDHLEASRRAKASGTKYKMSPEARKYFKNFLKKKVGLAAGVGLGTYGTIKGIEHLLKESSASPLAGAGGPLLPTPEKGTATEAALQGFGGHGTVAALPLLGASRAAGSKLMASAGEGAVDTAGVLRSLRKIEPAADIRAHVSSSPSYVPNPTEYMKKVHKWLRKQNGGEALYQDVHRRQINLPRSTNPFIIAHEVGHATSGTNRLRNAAIRHMLPLGVASSIGSMGLLAHAAMTGEEGEGMSATGYAAPVVAATGPALRQAEELTATLKARKLLNHSSMKAFKPKNLGRMMTMQQLNYLLGHSAKIAPVALGSLALHNYLKPKEEAPDAN